MHDERGNIMTEEGWLSKYGNRLDPDSLTIGDHQLSHSAPGYAIFTSSVLPSLTISAPSAASLSVAITCTSSWPLIWGIPDHHIVSPCGIVGLQQRISQFLVLRILKVHRFQFCLVTYPWYGASVDEIGDGGSRYPLGEWKGVVDANDFVERVVSFKAIDRVRFQVFLVEQGINWTGSFGPASRRLSSSSWSACTPSVTFLLICSVGRKDYTILLD